MPVTTRPTVASLQHVARHLLAWLAIVGTSGCSLALDGPKPNRPRDYAPQCDDNKGLVFADGLLATAVGIGALTAFGQDEPEGGVILGLIGVAFAASAVRGNRVVNECRGEKALFAQNAVPFDPRDEQPGRPVAGGPAHPRAAANAPVIPPPVAVAPPPNAPTDPYVEPPPRPPAPAPATNKPPTSPRPVTTTPAPAELDPEAWRDFWTEVP